MSEHNWWLTPESDKRLDKYSDYPHEVAYKLSCECGFYVTVPILDAAATMVHHKDGSHSFRIEPQRITESL